MTPESGPPGWTAFNLRPLGGPPPIRITTSLVGVPSGTSRIPTRWIWPESENIFVPLCFSDPISAHQSAPWRMIRGTLV